MITQLDGYTPEFVTRMKDLATLGLTPSQIAERMDMYPALRERFIADISTEDHPLQKEYLISRRRGEEDLETAMHTAAIVNGDPRSAKLVYEQNKQQKVDAVKKDLFGI